MSLSSVAFFYLLNFPLLLLSFQIWLSDLCKGMEVTNYMVIVTKACYVYLCFF